MNERERELIAALAEGSLQDETEARALLESSDEAQAEYRLQLAALQALSDLGPTAMHGAERADLHRELWTTLRADTAKSRSTSGIYGWSLAAATLFVVVGLAAVLGGGLLDGAQSGGDAAMEMVEETSAELAEDGAGTTAAGAEAFDAPASEGQARISPTEAYLAEQAERIRTGELRDRMEDESAADRDCLAEAGLTDHRVAAVINEDGSAPIEGRYLAAVPTAETIGPDTPIDFVESADCDVVYTDQ